jgi:hypothetical protein
MAKAKNKLPLVDIVVCAVMRVGEKLGPLQLMHDGK